MDIGSPFKSKCIDHGSRFLCKGFLKPWIGSPNPNCLLSVAALSLLVSQIEQSFRVGMQCKPTIDSRIQK